MLLPEALIPFQQELLTAQIRRELAEAELAELRLSEAQDKERDRSVRSGKIRHLPISGPIMPPATEDWLGALEHWERRDPGQPIVVTINSPGGSITDGLAVYDTLLRLRRKGSEVTTRGQGVVASMAAVLLQAGDTRLMDARAKMLIHQGSITIQGDTRMTRAEQDDLRVLQDMLLSDILDILAERSTLAREEIEERWERRDWWLSAEQALELGFVDALE